MKMQFLINALLPKLFHVPVVPTFCFYQNWSNHSLPPPTCLSDHILAATNDRHLWAIHGGHRNIGALYLGFLYGFLHFLSEENQTKNCSCGRLGGEIWFHLFHLTSVVMMTTVQFFRVSDISLFLVGESENIQELWIWSLVQRAKVPTPACSGAKSAAIVPTWPLNLENHKPGSLKKKIELQKKSYVAKTWVTNLYIFCIILLSFHITILLFSVYFFLRIWMTSFIFRTQHNIFGLISVCNPPLLRISPQ